MSIYIPQSTPVPLQIPSCRCAVDALDYNDFNLSGSTVQDWYDKSGRGVNFQQSQGSAIYTPALLNDKAGVVLGGAANLVADISISPAVTIFLVHQFPGITDGMIYDGITFDARIWLQTLNLGLGEIWTGKTGNGSPINTSQKVNTSPHCLRFEYNGASSKLFIDGVQGASGDTGTQGVVGITLGSQYNNIAYATVNVYGFYIYEGILSADNAALFESFAANTWGI